MSKPSWISRVFATFVFLVMAGAALPHRARGADDVPAAKPSTTPATQPTSDSGFLRFIENDKGGGALETAIVTYRNKNGVKVHLVAALHVGEKEYYAGLAKTFDDYDALLYELIKRKGTVAPVRGQPTGSAIGAFQRWLKTTLELDYQLDDIDYTKPNFVHADLDWETFEQLQSDRGESISGIMLQSMLHQWSRQLEGTSKMRDVTLIDLLVALRSPDRARQFKLMLAQSFGDIEDQMAGMTGPNGSVIITKRNKRALEVLKSTIESGKKEIGIFYGAGHMTDMEKRLVQMGFSRIGKTEWRIGWDMTQPPATQPAQTQPTEKTRTEDVEDPAPATK